MKGRRTWLMSLSLFLGLCQVAQGKTSDEGVINRRNAPRDGVDANDATDANACPTVGRGFTGHESSSSSTTTTTGTSSIFAPESWVHAGLKSRATLTCQVCAGGRPAKSHKAKVIWLKDGEHLATSTRIRPLKRHDGQYSIIIRHVRESDFGRYSCRIRRLFFDDNEDVGNRYKEADIELSGVPYPAVFDPPPPPSLESSATDTATMTRSFPLSWRVNCSTPIINYRLQFRQVDSADGLAGFVGVDTDWVDINVPGDDPRVGGAGMGHAQHVGHAHHGQRKRMSKSTSTGVAHHHHRGQHEHWQSYTLRGLVKDASYEARVRSRNAFGLSAQSEILSFHTFDIQNIRRFKDKKKELTEEQEQVDYWSNFVRKEKDGKEDGQQQQQEEEWEAKAKTKMATARNDAKSNRVAAGAGLKAADSDQSESRSSRDNTNSQLKASSEPLSTNTDKGFSASFSTGQRTAQAAWPTILVAAAVTTILACSGSTF